MTRIKTILLSMSLVAATAAPALAYGGYPGGQPPSRFAPEARRYDRGNQSQDTEEQRQLEQSLAAQSASERGRLEADLRRGDVSPREARLQREWLAEKQQMRDDHERQWLAEKQHARAENDQDWLANKDRIRARYERAWEAEKDRAIVSYQRAGLRLDRDSYVDVYGRGGYRY